jgi:hypothetical protein
MACYTFDAGSGDLDHGIEFGEEQGNKWIPVHNNGARRKINFCREHPPKRINALTLLCGELHKETVQRARTGDVALIHVHKARKIIPNHPEVVVHGKEVALVQLIPNTGIEIHSGEGRTRLIFRNGQIFKEGT